MHFANKRKSKQFFWLIWVIYAFVYMTKNCFSAAMASIVSEGVMTKSQTGFITALFYIVYMPLQIVGGFLADRYDPEKLMITGLIGGSIANLLIFFNQNYYFVLVIWTLNAVIQTGIWPSVFKIISSQLEPSQRKQSIYYISFNTAAATMMAYLVAAIVPKWYYNFAISSAVLLLSAIVLYFVSKKSRLYMVEDTEEKKTENSLNKTLVNDVPTGRLFLESGFYILLAGVFLRVIVLNCTKTLSATMLMECYDKISASIGNYINVVIVGVGIIGTVLVKTTLYPKHIKSAPTGITIMVAITLIFTIPLMFIGKISILVTVLSLCVMVASLTAGQLFTNYCSLRFGKFGKSGTASGITNAVSSFAVVVNSYGVTKAAEYFTWQTVAKFFVIMLAAALGLSIIALPFWKRFKEKYHANSPHPLTNQH